MPAILRPWVQVQALRIPLDVPQQPLKVRLVFMSVISVRVTTTGVEGGKFYTAMGEGGDGDDRVCDGGGGGGAAGLSRV